MCSCMDNLYFFMNFDLLLYDAGLILFFFFFFFCKMQLMCMLIIELFLVNMRANINQRLIEI